MTRRPTPRTRLAGAAALVPAVAAALAAGVAGAPAAAAAEVRPATAGSFVVDGQGFGHGIGLSQWGAQSRALAGQSYRTVLDAYYPTTAVGSRDDRVLRVGLGAFTGTSVRIAAPTGAALTLAGSGRRLAPGQQLVLTPLGAGLRATATGNGGWVEDWAGPASVTGPDGVLLVRADGTATRYLGTVRVVPGSTLTVVDDVRLETYLRGVVPAESPASWHPEALKAQAVAARSYALSVLRAGAQTDICDTTSCQVYRGEETRDASGRTTWSAPASTNAAIAATAGEVRTYDGDVAFTQFSSSNGGFSVAGSKPYLQAREDPFSAPAGRAPGDPVASWQVTVPAARFASACPAGGAVQGLVVRSRDGRGVAGGRVRAATVVCTTGTGEVTGTTLRQLGGLRSDWISIASAVQQRWTALGGAAGPLGAPRSAETTTPNGVGAFQHYAGGSVYASPATGAHEVRGAIRERWEQLGWENGFGFPTTGDVQVRGGYGTQFQSGSVYWSPATGAREVRGAIRDLWASTGWETGYLGFPVSGDLRLAGGFHQDFQGGSVYFSPRTGTHAVRGAIRATWAAGGWETGPLGYPVADEVVAGGTVTQRFQGGTLVWDAATRAVTRR